MRRYCEAAEGARYAVIPPSERSPETVLMQCPSCGATNNNSDLCIECGHATELVSSDNQSGVSQPIHRSTLIEFPGVSRSSIPEWRKELSVRVREVQERRAREAAREAEAERQRAEAVSCTPQLELLPQTEAPAINPLVAAALKRIERANQSASPEGFHHGRGKAATAIAYAPSLEVDEAVPDINETAPSVATQLTLASPSTSEIEPVETKPEKAHSLVVVPPVETPEVKVEAPRTPKRLIVDDPNDPALNYLDSIARNLRVDEVASNRASAFRRLMCGLFDLLTCALVASPIGLALYWKGVDLTEIRPLAILIGAAVMLTFLYFTLSIGMTGRTWAMRMFSMRVIDIRTGLIPTGGQSAGRAFFYLISLTMAGLGILYALISREGETMHDRLTRTAVIKI
jgi:uncharacterized RDD family membrane protein YckC